MTRFSLPDYRRRVELDGKIVKAEDYRALVESQELLDNLKLQLQQALEQNEAVFQQQKSAGYAEGLRQVKAQQAEQIFVTATQVIDYVSSVEQTLAKIVLTVIRRVFSEFEDTEIVAHLVQQSLQQFRDQSRIKIYIPAQDNARQTRKKLTEILAPASDLSVVDIVESPEVDKTGCRIESDMGSVETDLENLMQTMEAAFNEHFAARR